MSLVWRAKLSWDQLLALPPTIDKQKRIHIAEDFNDLWDFHTVLEQLMANTLQFRYIIFLFSIRCCILRDFILSIVFSFQCPNNARSNFYNYKNSHNIILLVICIAHYVFRFVDINAYDRHSDGFKENAFKNLRQRQWTFQKKNSN